MNAGAQPLVGTFTINGTRSVNAGEMVFLTCLSCRCLGAVAGAVPSRFQGDVGALPVRYWGGAGTLPGRFRYAAVTVPVFGCAADFNREIQVRVRASLRRD